MRFPSSLRNRAGASRAELYADLGLREHARVPYLLNEADEIVDDDRDVVPEADP